MKTQKPPILNDKQYTAASVFQPENLIREARAQKGIAPAKVPPLCVLDPDGDIVRHLRRSGAAKPAEQWACYHSEMDLFALAGQEIGIVGCAVGAPYAVLIAEQAFASGCELLVSITSSGQLAPLGPTPYFVLVERALRDEGTSYHYLPPAEFAEADGKLIDAAEAALAGAGPPIRRGATWTTDAPFRETETVLQRGREMGLAAIEMECAALYAFAQARERPVICLAHVTNTMAVSEGDFEKGAHGGAQDALLLIERLAALVA
ncbi:MAG TPA: nucleoside phosphorylase [Alphaproteobacteria bacterium]|nr:nucleoside phosphorylase [Alphaproteobacteria bacterium]